MNEMRFWVCSSVELPVGFFSMQECLDYAKNYRSKSNVMILYGQLVDQLSGINKVLKPHLATGESDD